MIDRFDMTEMGKLQHPRDSYQVIGRDGVSRWLDDSGIVHREDGPAVIDTKHGLEVWYRFGKRHRLDGPACVTSGGCEWYVDGRRFTETEFNLYVDPSTGEVFVPPGKKLEHDPEIVGEDDIFNDVVEYYDEDEVGCDDEVDLYID